jgi:predicted ribonuclease YlaK
MASATGPASGMTRMLAALENLKLFLPLAADLSRWFLVLDTNVFVHFDPFRNEIDHDKWCEILEVPHDTNLQLVVPVLVLDELDEHTHSRDRKLSTRARAAQRHLDHSSITS